MDITEKDISKKVLAMYLEQGMNIKPLDEIDVVDFDDDDIMLYVGKGNPLFIPMGRYVEWLQKKVKELSE